MSELHQPDLITQYPTELLRHWAGAATLNRLKSWSCQGFVQHLYPHFLLLLYPNQPFL
ncbi:hypothetical protein EcE22_2632 [Escherichia coli E22]|nr:hypothetical protein EcE22_2632 [Escherichia coli E22]